MSLGIIGSADGADDASVGVAVGVTSVGVAVGVTSLSGIGSWPSRCNPHRTRLSEPHVSWHPAQKARPQMLPN